MCLCVVCCDVTCLCVTSCSGSHGRVSQAGGAQAARQSHLTRQHHLARHAHPARRRLSDSGLLLPRRAALVRALCSCAVFIRCIHTLYSYAVFLRYIMRCIYSLYSCAVFSCTMFMCCIHALRSGDRPIFFPYAVMRCVFQVRGARAEPRR